MSHSVPYLRNPNSPLGSSMQPSYQVFKAPIIQKKNFVIERRTDHRQENQTMLSKPSTPTPQQQVSHQTSHTVPLSFQDTSQYGGPIAPYPDRQNLSHSASAQFPPEISNFNPSFQQPFGGIDHNQGLHPRSVAAMTSQESRYPPAAHLSSQECRYPPGTHKLVSVADLQSQTQDIQVHAV